jgi:hypothetical protein
VQKAINKGNFGCLPDRPQTHAEEIETCVGESLHNIDSLEEEKQ